VIRTSHWPRPPGSDRYRLDLHELFQPIRLQDPIVLPVLGQIEHDLCPTRSTPFKLQRLPPRVWIDGELVPRRCGFKDPLFRRRVRGRGGREGDHLDSRGDQVGRVEAQAELTDKVAAFVRTAAAAGRRVSDGSVEDFGGTRFGDRTEVGSQLILGHTNPSIWQFHL
jgi:hypothetical protein